MPRNLQNLFLAFGALILVSACFCRSDRDRVSTSEAPRSANISANSDVNSEAVAFSDPRKNDLGDFLVEHLEISTPRYREIDEQVKSEKLLEKAADKLNRALILPTNITLRTKDCDERNAFYSPKDRSITICYELMEHFFSTFRSVGNSEEKAYSMMFDAVRFVFLHEIGHALIDVYKLPITGNEEDAADRLSAFVNLKELGEDGVRAIFAAADAFAIESKRRPGGQRNLAGEHLLQEQRYYNALCMVYGSNTEKYGNVVTDGYLPNDRAIRCPAEFKRMVESWTLLLEPWRKD